MRPSFHPRLVNGPFDDPGLFISFLFEKRAMLFDLGDIHSLSARDILKVSHVFITHTHMDHFVGFDRLLRLFLGRDKHLYLYGPEGILKNVEGKLCGYSWNLVEHYGNQFVLHVTEIHPEYTISCEYLCQNNFLPTRAPVKRPFNCVLLDEPALSVSGVRLDHKITSLGFSIKERFHVNIMKDRVYDLGLEIGPWLKTFKAALYSREDPESKFEVRFGQKQAEKKEFILGDLSSRIARITPGQKVTYIADVVFNEANVDKIISFAKDSDHLFIEAAFLEKHRDIALRKSHLTAHQAGRIGALAGVKQLTPFHFSPRYIDQEHLLREEVMTAYNSGKD